MNTALMTSVVGLSPAEARDDREFYGRLIETAVGAHLVNAAARGVGQVFYWRSRNREVDFVVRVGKRLIALEVKSGRRRDGLSGMNAFAEEFRPDRMLLVGAGGIALDEFLEESVEHWIEP